MFVNLEQPSCSAYKVPSSGQARPRPSHPHRPRTAQPLTRPEQLRLTGSTQGKGPIQADRFKSFILDFHCTFSMFTGLGTQILTIVLPLLTVFSAVPRVQVCSLGA